MRHSFILVIGLLAGCAPAAAPTPIGSVTVTGTDYPVDAVAGIWRVHGPRGVVTCAKNNLDSCKWSLRHDMQAAEAPEIMGN